jgi:hypothetical protein
MRWWLPLVLVAVACGSRTATPSGSGSTGTVSEALSWVGCGPTDGPAIVVLIADGHAACADRLALQSSDHLDVEIWSGAFPSAGQTVTLQGSAGAAAICKSGTCVPLVGATVTSDGNDGTGWIATLTYTDGGVTKTTTFHTTECVVQPIMCG